MGRLAIHFHFWFAWVLIVFGAVSGCSILATRPVQEMSDTAAAIKAAREAQADTLTPELFRKADEAYQLARREYQFKNFDSARDLAAQARNLAERAEFDAIRAANKGDGEVEPTATPSPQPSPSGD